MARQISVGTILKKEMEARGWSNEYLSKISNIPLSNLECIISGSESISAESDMNLSSIFGTSFGFWMDLENNLTSRLYK